MVLKMELDAGVFGTPSSQRVTVLYLAGWGRSGTTILDNVLGQTAGMFSVGEIQAIWQHGLAEHRLCGCSTPLTCCDVWRRVFEEAYGGFDRVDVGKMLELGGRVRTRHLPLLLTPLRGQVEERVQDYLVHLAKLYSAIRSVTNCQVIVDSSKYLAYGQLVSSLPNVDLKLIHVIRDPRGTAYSWQRRKENPDGKKSVMPVISPWKNSVYWDTFNVAAEFVGRKLSPQSYRRLRYEDFIADPQGTVDRIQRWVGVLPDRTAFVGDHTVRLNTTHTVSGNPSRFKTGDVELRLDDEWKRKLAPSMGAQVAALTWPLLERYGYTRRGSSG
jgi:hypothetical protein